MAQPPCPLFNVNMLKAMTYGSEMWSLTKAEENLLAKAERVMEWRVLGVFLHYHIQPTLRQMSGVKVTVVPTREKQNR